MAQDVQVVQITNQPYVFPGDPRTDEHMRRQGEWFKSGTIASTDTTSINLFEVPGNSILLNFGVRVLAAFDGTGSSAAATATITVPNDTGTEVIWDAAGVNLQSSGMKAATGALMIAMPSSGGFITMSYTPNTTTAGSMEVYVELLQGIDRL